MSTPERDLHRYERERELRDLADQAWGVRKEQLKGQLIADGEIRLHGKPIVVEFDVHEAMSNSEAFKAAVKASQEFPAIASAELARAVMDAAEEAIKPFETELRAEFEGAMEEDFADHYARGAA